MAGLPFATRRLMLKEDNQTNKGHFSLGVEEFNFSFGFLKVHLGEASHRKLSMIHWQEREKNIACSIITEFGVSGSSWKFKAEPIKYLFNLGINTVGCADHIYNSRKSKRFIICL